MKTNKLLVFSTIALLIINIVLVYFLWNNKHKSPRKERGGERGDWVVNELKLDDQQKAEHKKLKDAHFANIKPVFDSISASRRQLYQLLKEATPNDSLVDHYTRLIGEQHTRISKYTFEHFRQLRAICNPEQQVKLDSVVQRIVLDMGRKGGKQGKGEKK